MNWRRISTINSRGMFFWFLKKSQLFDPKKEHQQKHISTAETKVWFDRALGVPGFCRSVAGVTSEDIWSRCYNLRMLVEFFQKRGPCSGINGLSVNVKICVDIGDPIFWRGVKFFLAHQFGPRGILVPPKKKWFNEITESLHDYWISKQT